MTQKDIFQTARDVLVPTVKREKANRKTLQRAARAKGRSAEAVYKASTMRLALWATKGTSAI
tara:strand:- start:332 stop:517 length:186 start_codon:yes stop_codon:yes gene_type:complete